MGRPRTRPEHVRGYGPLHLTNVSVEQAGDAKGDGSSNRSTGPDSLRTAHLAADLTGLSVGRLTSDDAANICGGAALLASYQRDLGQRTGTSSPTSAWYDAVKTYSGDASTSSAGLRHRESSRRSSRARSARPTTPSGSASSPSAASRCRRPGRRPRAIDAARRLPGDAGLPVDPRPVRAVRRDPGDYGNHDLGEPRGRPDDRLHRHPRHRGLPTPARSTWSRTRPTSAGTTRSARVDGHVAQHLEAKDVGFHAGNWYVNVHSIGIEHEGFAAQGAWYTESLYRGRRRW